MPISPFPLPKEGPVPIPGPTASGALLVLVLALAGCGDDAEPTTDAASSTDAASTQAATGSDGAPLTPDAAALGSGSLVSTEVVGHELVDGTAVHLGFDAGTMSASAGCNTLFGAYDVTDGVLRWPAEPAATMIGCDEELAAQDDWLRDLLTTGVEATTDGAGLELSAGEVSLTMEPEPEADLESLLGRTWSVVGTISDGSTSRLPARVRTPRLVVGTDGLARLDTGCNTGRTRVRVDRTSITFSPPTTTRAGCPEPDSVVEQVVLSVVDGRSDYVRHDGSVLVLVKGDTGLVFSVR